MPHISHHISTCVVLTVTMALSSACESEGQPWDENGDAHDEEPGEESGEASSDEPDGEPSVQYGDDDDLPISYACRLCTDPNLTGSCINISPGVTVALNSTYKNKVSSLTLPIGLSLKYWTWEQSSVDGKRGIIYRRAQHTGYETTDWQDLSPETWLNTNDDFDTVTCEDMSDWLAIVYKDPNRSGGRMYLRPNVQYDLSSWGLLNKVSSVAFPVNIKLEYWTAASVGGYGWIQRAANWVYSSSAGGGDNTPESSLGTNDQFDFVKASSF